MPAATRTTIEITGAKQNNLKNVSVEIPRDKLTVITGVSGSGKSTLAFDIVYGEAQRRFLDSISNYAKNRIAQVKKPKVESIKGLSPVIAIEQKKGNSNPRSTIGTVTDINDYLRLLFATAGNGCCPRCGHPLKQQNAGQTAERIASLPPGTKVVITAPAYKIYGESYEFLFSKIRENGYRHMIINGADVDLSDKKSLELDEEAAYEMETVIDRITVKREMYVQIAKTIEAAVAAMEEDLFIRVEPDAAPEGFYEGFACPEHHFVLCEMQPFHFSFNVPASACNTCTGVGMSHVVEPRFLVVSPEKSISKGALVNTAFNLQSRDSYRHAVIYSLAKKYNFSLDTPYNELPESVRDIILYGTKGEKLTVEQPPESKKRNWIVGRETAYWGLVNEIQGWYRHYIRKSMNNEIVEYHFIKELMIEKVCPDCNGARLKKQRLAVTLGGRNIDELSRMQIPELVEFLESLTFEPDKRDAAAGIINEIRKRLQLLLDIGLYYLSLSRRSDSVSGGEMQRIKMSTQISSELMGMLYIMDEPSIGLHMRDSRKVVDLMHRLRDIGNTVIVVEHDLETMRNADYLIEIGPGPGIHGGNIMAKGTFEEFVTQNIMTADYLNGEKKIEVPNKRRPMKDKDYCITVYGARENNLKNIDVKIPLGVLTCVTGVSGSGKSTLINEILFKQMEIIKKTARIEAGKHDRMTGHEKINSLINIDQSPIGRGSKSNPATYVGIYDRIRNIFASTKDAVERGYVALDFSLTHANGCRCEHCSGDGVLTTNLHFMADIETICPVCKGRRFSSEGIEVKYNGKSIADVLEMTVEEAADFFSGDKLLKHKIGIMNELGLSYMTLGQSSTTLSGGEAQRVKLAYELAKIKRGSHNFYVLDEPTTGLHLYDVQRLLDCLNKIVDNGHSVLIIEHNLDVIKCADYILDMGPEGGKDGGTVVACGTPEEVAKNPKSYTGMFLRDVLR